MKTESEREALITVWRSEMIYVIYNSYCTVDWDHPTDPIEWWYRPDVNLPLNGSVWIAPGTYVDED